MLGFVRFRITNPYVFSEPLMRCIAMRTVGLTEKYRAGAEGRGFHICVGRNCPPGLWATDHKNTHHAYSQLSLMGVLPLRYDERIKVRRQFPGFLTAEGDRRIYVTDFVEVAEPTVRLVADTKPRSV